MKRYFFMIAVLASLILSACDRTRSGANAVEGTLALKVESDDKDYIDIQTKSAVDINTFKIVISDEGGTPIKIWNSYAEVPSTVNLSPGTYVVVAESPENEPAAFDQPVYRGESSFVIESSKLTTANVVCSLFNVKVSIVLGESFVSEVKDYTVTVRAVDYNKSLVFTPEAISQGKSGYFSVSPLEVHIIGKRILDDSEVNHVKTITDVRSRDHLILNLNARATGDLGSFTISIDYGTNERNEDIDVPGFDEDPVEGNDPDPDPDPDPVGKPEIEFSCPDEVTFTNEQAAAAVVDVTVKTEKGIANLYVEIKSETLLGLLESLNLSEAVASGNWDIANITDPALAEFLTGLGLYSSDDPINNKTEHTFSIGSFMALMPSQDDPYPFVIRVIDNDGAEATRTLTVYRRD